MLHIPPRNPPLPKPKRGQSPDLDWGGENDRRKETKDRKFFAMIASVTKTNERLNLIFFKCSLNKSLLIANVDQVHLNLLFLIVIYLFILVLSG